MKRSKVLLAALGFAAASAFALPAAAQMTMSSVYIGGSVGQAEFKDACVGVAGCDDKDTAWRLLGGYQINRNFAAEVGYHHFGKASAPGVAIKGDAWELVGLGMFPVMNAFSIYGKLGVYRGELEGEGAAAGIKETNTDLTYGLGAQFDISRNLGVRAEWQRYPDMGGGAFGGESDVDVLSVGVIWRFQ